MGNDLDPAPIPAWALQEDSAYPCPCGEPMEPGNLVIIKGKNGLKRTYHHDCYERHVQMKRVEGADEDSDEEIDFE